MYDDLTKWAFFVILMIYILCQKLLVHSIEPNTRLRQGVKYSFLIVIIMLSRLAKVKVATNQNNK